MSPPTKPLRSLRLAALMIAAGLALGACSENDNLGDFEYPNFPGIKTSAISDEADADADLTGDALAYQAALIYETVLNDRGYDGIQRPLTEANGRQDCALDGYVYYKKEAIGFPLPPYGNGPFDISQVASFGCTVTDTGTTMRAAVGELNFSNDDGDCDGTPCAIAYNSYNNFRVQYLTPAGAGAHAWQRAELHGSTLDGPGDAVTVGGIARDVLVKRQSLTYVNSVSTLTASGAVEGAKTYGIVYGVGGVFERREIAGVNLIELDGRLTSGSDPGADCVGGELKVTTETGLTVAASNITAGELTLSTGSGDSLKEASLVFQANGDVALTDADNAISTVTRDEIEALRNTCFQTVVVKR